MRGISKENQFNANSATNKFKARLSYVGGYSQESCWHCYCILLISKVNPYPLSSTSNLLNHYTPVNRQLEGLKARTKRTQCLLIPILGNTQRLQRLHSSLPARGKNGTQGLEPARQALYRGSCFIGFILYLRFPYTLYPRLPELTIQLTLVSNLQQSSCLSLPSAGIIGVNHHTQLRLYKNFK